MVCKDDHAKGTNSSMKKILVIGASGFVGGRVARTLLADGHSTRCLARSPAKVSDLAKAGSEVVQGDISDLTSMQHALESVESAYISVHTLSPQPGSAAHQGFMDVEMTGLRNIVTACKAQGVRRLIYVTFLGTAPDASSAWVRGRWDAEQFLLNSGLDVTVIRPGMIVGVGGQGFDMMMSQAKKRVAITLGDGVQKWRSIALDDLAYYLVGVLNDPRANGQCYDVGCDDILSRNQMIDVAAEVLGRPHPWKVHVPQTLLGVLAPLIEHQSKFPRGSIKGIVDSLKMDAIGDPTLIRKILPRRPLSYRQAVERALTKGG